MTMADEDVLSQWVVTVDGTTYPLDLSRWMFQENRRCEQWLDLTRDEFFATLDAGPTSKGWVDVVAFAAWMGLSRAGENPPDLFDMDFDVAGLRLEPADVEAFTAALEAKRAEDEAGPLADSEDGTSGAPG